MSDNDLEPGRSIDIGNVTLTEQVVSRNELLVEENSLYCTNDQLLSYNEIEFLNPVKLRNSVKEGSDKLDKFLRSIGPVNAPDAFLASTYLEDDYELDSLDTMEELLNQQFKVLGASNFFGLNWTDDIQHTYSNLPENKIQPKITLQSSLRRPSQDSTSPTSEEPESKKQKVSTVEAEDVAAVPVPKKTVVTPLKIKIPPRKPVVIPSFMDAVNAPVPKKIKKKKKIVPTANSSTSTAVTVNTEKPTPGLVLNVASSEEITEPQVISSLPENVAATASTSIEATVSPNVDVPANAAANLNSSPTWSELEEPEPCEYFPGEVESLLEKLTDDFADQLKDPADDVDENEEPWFLGGGDIPVSESNLRIKPEPVDNSYERQARRVLEEDNDSDREDYRRPNKTANEDLYEVIVLSSDSEDEYPVYVIEKDQNETKYILQSFSKKKSDKKSTPSSLPKPTLAESEDHALVQKVVEPESRQDKLKRIYKNMGMKEFETNKYPHMQGYTTAAEQMADNATNMTGTYEERDLQNKLAKKPVAGWNRIPVYRPGHEIFRLHYPFDQYGGAFWPVVQPFDGIDVDNPNHIVRVDVEHQLSNMSCYSGESQKWFLCSTEPERWDESFKKAVKMNDQEMKANGRFKHRIGYQKVNKNIDIVGARSQDADHQAIERRFYETKDNEEVYVMTAEETRRIKKNELPCNSKTMHDHVRFNLTDEYSSAASEGNNARDLTTPECWLSTSERSLVSSHDKKWILLKFVNDRHQRIYQWMKRFDFPNTKHSVMIVRDGFQAAFAYQWRNSTCLCYPGEQEKEDIKRRIKKLKELFVRKMRDKNTIEVSHMLKYFQILDFEFSYWTIIWDSCVSYFRAYPPISSMLPLLQPSIDATFKSVAKLENRQRYCDQFMTHKKMLSVKWNIPELEAERARKEKEAHRRALENDRNR